MSLPPPTSTLFPYTTLFRSLSILNPLHIPFWLSWTNVLMDRNILIDAKQFPAYVSGIGVGSLLGFQVFIAGGKDRKSTRLNSSHSSISYAVFCLKKKK